MRQTVLPWRAELAQRQLPGPVGTDTTGDTQAQLLVKDMAYAEQELWFD
jgi:hypothetical protein